MQPSPRAMLEIASNSANELLSSAYLKASASKEITELAQALCGIEWTHQAAMTDIAVIRTIHRTQPATLAEGVTQPTSVEFAKEEKEEARIEMEALQYWITLPDKKTNAIPVKSLYPQNVLVLSRFPSSSNEPVPLCHQRFDQFNALLQRFGLHIELYDAALGSDAGDEFFSDLFTNMLRPRWLPPLYELGFGREEAVICVLTYRGRTIAAVAVHMINSAAPFSKYYWFVSDGKSKSEILLPAGDGLYACITLATFDTTEAHVQRYVNNLLLAAISLQLDCADLSAWRSGTDGVNPVVDGIIFSPQRGRLSLHRQGDSASPVPLDRPQLQNGNSSRE